MSGNQSMDDRLAVVDAELARMKNRLQELEDDREIRELLARYGFFADTKQDEAWVNLFTDDGIMNLGSGGGHEGMQRWQGHDQLMAFITDTDDTKPKASGMEDRMTRKREGRIMHVQGSNLVTHIEGNDAIAESYSVVLMMKDGQVNVSAGSNRWTLQRLEGRWQIKERLRRALGGKEYHQVLISHA